MTFVALKSGAVFPAFSSLTLSLCSVLRHTSINTKGARSLLFFHQGCSTPEAHRHGPSRVELPKESAKSEIKRHSHSGRVVAVSVVPTMAPSGGASASASASAPASEAFGSTWVEQQLPDVCAAPQASVVPVPHGGQDGKVKKAHEQSSPKRSKSSAEAEAAGGGPDRRPRKEGVVGPNAHWDFHTKSAEEIRGIQLQIINGSTPWMGETPALVKELVQMAVDSNDEMEAAAASADDAMPGSPKGGAAAGMVEEGPFRDMYARLPNPEDRLRAFAARQVSTRMLHCLSYLCPSCWLPQEEDCMCHLIPRAAPLSPHVCFWVYMHPKEYLRKNNTGKLLWQVLGAPAARLAICGIAEHEAAMWQAFKEAGREAVWCVYPARKAEDCTVTQMRLPPSFAAPQQQEGEGEGDEGRGGGGCGGGSSGKKEKVMHLVLIDGTWSNSKAMLSRLQGHARECWEGRDMVCLGLSPHAPSAMHHLRPQPSKDKTCTAAAATHLLRELHGRPELGSLGLLEAADSVDEALDSLLKALSSRRERSGRTSLRLGVGKNTGYLEDRSTTWRHGVASSLAKQPAR